MSLYDTGIREEIFQQNAEESTFVVKIRLQYVVQGQTVFDERDGIREALLRTTVSCWSAFRFVTFLGLSRQSALAALRGTHHLQCALRLLLLLLLSGRRTVGGDRRR